MVSVRLNEMKFRHPVIRSAPDNLKLQLVVIKLVKLVSKLDEISRIQVGTKKVSFDTRLISYKFQSQ